MYVLPSIDPAFRDQCLATLHPRAQVCVVENYGINRGVAASWNKGITAAATVRAIWLVLLSESVRFGASGGLDLEERLAQEERATWVVTSCDHSCPEPPWDSKDPAINNGAGFCRQGFGWHLQPLRMDAVMRVGQFDEHFWPAWYEDLDYWRRMGLAGVRAACNLVERLDAHLVACEHSVAAGLVAGDNSASRARFLAKWGNPDGGEDEWYSTPYGHNRLTWTYVGDEP